MESGAGGNDRPDPLLAIALTTMVEAQPRISVGCYLRYDVSYRALAALIYSISGLSYRSRLNRIKRSLNRQLGLSSHLTYVLSKYDLLVIY
jgi:hypothetical protein